MYVSMRIIYKILLVVLLISINACMTSNDNIDRTYHNSEYYYTPINRELYEHFLRCPSKYDSNVIRIDTPMLKIMEF